MQICGENEPFLDVLRGLAERMGAQAQPIAYQTRQAAEALAQQGYEGGLPVTWQSCSQEGWARVMQAWPMCQRHSVCWYTAWNVFCLHFRIGWCNAAYPPSGEVAA